jgi:uncharacterized protein affecting Mg2+/Co2+ transport
MLQRDKSVSNLVLILFSTYSISITLKQIDPRWPSVQLISRRWEIEYDNGNVEIVEGPGVIGLYPKFNEIDQPFEYSSLCGGTLTKQPFKLGGCLQFVPGTLESPLGAPFNVIVPDIKFRRFFIRNGQF